VEAFVSCPSYLQSHTPIEETEDTSACDTESSLDVMQEAAVVALTPLRRERRRESLVLSLEKKGSLLTLSDICETADTENLATVLISKLADDEMAMIQEYSVKLSHAGISEDNAYDLAMNSYVSGVLRAHDMAPSEKHSVIAVSFIDDPSPEEDDDELLVLAYVREIIKETGIDSSVAYSVALDTYLANKVEFRKRVARWPDVSPAAVVIDDEVVVAIAAEETADELVAVLEETAEAAGKPLGSDESDDMFDGLQAAETLAAEVDYTNLAADVVSTVCEEPVETVTATETPVDQAPVKRGKRKAAVTAPETPVTEPSDVVETADAVPLSKRGRGTRALPAEVAATEEKPSKTKAASKKAAVKTAKVEVESEDEIATAILCDR
jgi:hypothetical protein